MSRTRVSCAFRRLQPEAFVVSLLAAFVLAACSAADSSPSPTPSSSAGVQGAAGSGASGAPSTGSGDPRACDVADAVCVTSCPLVREGVRCDRPDPCPSGYVVSLTCGATGPAPSACTGIAARDGAFCANACPESAPSTCDHGVARCAEGWKLLSSCAG